KTQIQQQIAEIDKELKAPNLTEDQARDLSNLRQSLKEQIGTLTLAVEDFSQTITRQESELRSQLEETRRQLRELHRASDAQANGQRLHLQAEEERLKFILEKVLPLKKEMHVLADQIFRLGRDKSDEALNEKRDLKNRIRKLNELYDQTMQQVGQETGQYLQ